MNEIIYLDPESEITSVIDRIKKTEGSSVSLVIPRGGTLAQSIVNLKLLKKSAAELDKEISLVANDRISRNLASQIGLTVYSKVDEASRAHPKRKAALSDKEVDDSIKVNNYYRNKDVEDESEDEPTVEGEADDEDQKAVLDEDSRTEDDGGEKMMAEVETVGEGKENEVGEEIEYKPVDESRHSGHESNQKMRGAPKLKHSRRPILIFALISLILVLAVSFIFLPYATATVQLKTEDYSADFSIAADKNEKTINKDKLLIPSQLVELEKEETGEFAATGKKDIGEKSKGTLNFNNNAGVEDSIQAGATVKSAGGVEFTLDQTISLPKATASVNASGDIALTPGKVSGKVTAKRSGAEGNLPSNTLYSVSGKPLVTANGETSGGVTKELKIVSSADLENAAKAINEKINEGGRAEIIKKAEENGLTILESEIKSETISSSGTKNEGDEVEIFNYSVKLKFFVLGFLNKELDSLTRELVNDEIGTDKMVVNPEKAEISYKISESDVDEGRMLVKSTFKGRIGGKMNTSEIAKELKNKSIIGAKEAMLKKEGVNSVEIKPWPKSYNRTPLLVNRIKIIFDYAQ